MTEDEKEREKNKAELQAEIDRVQRLLDAIKTPKKPIPIVKKLIKNNL